MTLGSFLVLQMSKGLGFFLVLALMLAVTHRIWDAGTHSAHEDCPNCGLWIGDPELAGEPRICPVCGSFMLAAGSTRRRAWDWRKV